MDNSLYDVAWSLHVVMHNHEGQDGWVTLRAIMPMSDKHFLLIYFMKCIVSIFQETTSLFVDTYIGPCEEYIYQ